MDLNFPPWLIWFLLGIGLAMLELMLPGFVIIFFGLGCVITSVVLLLVDLSLDQQIMVFLAGSILSLLALRKYMMQVFRGASSDEADAMEAPPVGLKVKVVQPISRNMPGKISYRGSYWNALADEDIDADETVEIVGFAPTSRSTFRVKKV
ncbi:MAG: NfeD family protein [Desulfovibrionales bacterium]